MRKWREFVSYLGYITNIWIRLSLLWIGRFPVLGVTSGLREKLNRIHLEDNPTTLVTDKENMGTNTTVAYTFVCFGKSSDGTHYACFYAYYSAEIKFIRKDPIYGTPYLWGLLQSEEDIENIHDFFLYKALDGFLKNGVISKINFVE